VVASWTGAEIEFYRGRHLGGNAVAEAFQIPASSLGPGQFGSTGDGSASGTSRMRWIGPAVAITVLLFMLAHAPASCRSRGRARPETIERAAAPACDFHPGDRGHLGGLDLRILSQARVEVAEVGRIHERHEFLLEAADGTRFLLLSGWAAPGGDWYFCREPDPRPRLNPAEAAALPRGAKVEVGGLTGTVTSLFRCTGGTLEGLPAHGLLPSPGEILSGLMARSGPDVLVARWDARNIRWHHGKAIPAAEVRSAFRPAPHP
jgi:hypothetical protein